MQRKRLDRYITFRISEELYQALVKGAEKERRSLSSFIRLFLEANYKEVT